MKIKDNFYYIGANDENLDLFESQYKVPNGMSYNSYVIKDEKNVVLDTVDKSVSEEWLKKLEKALNGENVDYLIISHLEPDHSYNIGVLAKKYPNMKIVGNAMTFNILPKFFEDIEIEKRKVLVKDEDTLKIGKHVFKFYMAPMVHWPEVMVAYESSEKVLFAADELTGLIWAAALMRPSKSTKDMELKSLKKKYKSKGFAAGCSREVIERGADQLGWELDKLLEMTLQAMAASEDTINAEMEAEQQELQS